MAALAKKSEPAVPVLEIRNLVGDGPQGGVIPAIAALLATWR